MRKIYTTVSFCLCFAWALLGGPDLTRALAQSDCGINVSYFPPDPFEVTKDGIKYKRVQVVVNNPGSGPAGRFYFLFDSEVRNDSTKSYEYGYNTEVFLVPVTTQKITFYDFNNFSCYIEYTPNF